MNPERDKLRDTRRWVVKIGSSLITDDGRGLRTDLIEQWVAQIAALVKRGYQVVVVSSGSIAEGVARLGWERNARALHELQSAAAVGQMGLVQAYESCFSRLDLHTAQILLTHDDISDRSRYLNARSVLRTLIKLGVIPVVNENDTVATAEIQFGDNDTLAGLVTNLVEADLLVLLTDQSGLFTGDPRSDPEATLIPEGAAGDDALESLAGEGGAWGRGGMRTKLGAARLAARSGAGTVIASGREDNVIERISAGENIGTFLSATQEPMAARKQWLASTLKVQGQLLLDSGAARVLRQEGRSLLAVGVTEVRGDFQRGELVVCLDTEGREVGRGLVNYATAEAAAILGLPSDKIEASLGYSHEPELIHRDNLVIFPG
jgi:glutamate 5-kinase